MTLASSKNVKHCVVSHRAYTVSELLMSKSLPKERKQAQTTHTRWRQIIETNQRLNKLIKDNNQPWQFESSKWQ